MNEGTYVSIPNTPLLAPQSSPPSSSSSSPKDRFVPAAVYTQALGLSEVREHLEKMGYRNWLGAADQSEEDMYLLLSCLCAKCDEG
jgi:hypothetical protein